MDVDGLLLNSQCLANKDLLNKTNHAILTIWVLSILLNNIDVSDLSSFIHNAAVNIFAITNPFCISDGFPWIDS